jgi:hypothetical protein
MGGDVDRDDLQNPQNSPKSSLLAEPFLVWTPHIH